MLDNKPGHAASCGDKTPHPQHRHGAGDYEVCSGVPEPRANPPVTLTELSLLRLIVRQDAPRHQSVYLTESRGHVCTRCSAPWPCLTRQYLDSQPEVKPFDPESYTPFPVTDQERDEILEWLKNPTGAPFGGDAGCRS